MSISEDEIARHSDIFGQEDLEKIKAFAQNVIAHYAKAFESTYTPLVLETKEITNDKEKIAKRYGDR